jgi:hypothetical protein
VLGDQDATTATTTTATPTTPATAAAAADGDDSCRDVAGSLPPDADRLDAILSLDLADRAELVTTL